MEVDPTALILTILYTFAVGIFVGWILWKLGGKKG